MTQLEIKFRDNYQRAQQLVRAGKKSEALPYLKHALEALYTLAKEALNIDKRKDYLEQASKLRPIYDQIKEEVESNNKIEVTSTKKTSEKKEESAKDENGIETVFDGIDVMKFIEKQNDSKVTFNDVKGMDKEINMVRKEFTTSEELVKYRERLGIENKNFLLFYGVPGTGKTFFAKAMANELGIPFFSVPCTKLKGSLHGQTENNIIAIFNYCRQYDRCILFLDEFDAIGLDRNRANASEVSQSTVTTLLTQIDGFGSSKNILVIAATNFPYLLDGAIISRANVLVEVPLPTRDVILQVITAKLSSFIDESVNLEQLCDRLIGYSNRDISKLVSAIKSQSLDDFDSQLNNDGDVDYETFKINNKHIEEALKLVGPTTKKSDLMQIERFNEENRSL